MGTAIASEDRDLPIEHAVVVDVDQLGGCMFTRNSDILRPRGHFERLRLNPHRHSRLTPPRH
ncbi:hypothetical protein [Sphingomonas sp. DC1100-1]|uniref:hypothetical protein n=1 Tax=unclassified Sphingomonas TaxID=196159 RepID=UPI003CF4D1D6